MWKCAKYLQCGLRHVAVNIPCQDRVLIRENDKCIVAALADGLGSMKDSEIAAEIVTETICEFFLKCTSQNTPFVNEERKCEVKKEIVFKLKNAVSECAAAKGKFLSDMNCTLVFVVVVKSENYAIVGMIGDSAVCVIKDSEAILLGDNDSETANGTDAVLSEGAEKHLELSIIDIGKEQVRGFILTSDGLEDEIYSKSPKYVNKKAERYFNAVSCIDNSEDAIKDYIQELTNSENSVLDDDISIAVLSNTSSPIKLPDNPTWLCKCGERNEIENSRCKKCDEDFLKLYDVDFSSEGGKFAYFKRLNKDPHKERNLLGIKDNGQVLNACKGDNDNVCENTNLCSSNEKQSNSLTKDYSKESEQIGIKAEAQTSNPCIVNNVCENASSCSSDVRFEDNSPYREYHEYDENKNKQKNKITQKIKDRFVLSIISIFIFALGTLFGCILTGVLELEGYIEIDYAGLILIFAIVVFAIMLVFFIATLLVVKKLIVVGKEIQKLIEEINLNSYEN